MIDRNHPAVEMLSALEAETMRVERVECAVAGMPASDHPVVQRAARVLDAARSKSATTSAYLSILTALEHLTADDLRNTPAGKQLLAEGWDAACRKVIHMAWADSSDAEYLADEGNPYRTEAPSDAPEG